MRKLSAGICLLIAATAATDVHAQSVEEFYKGKTLTAIVGNGPGGGFDFITRLLARHMGKYIPGQPRHRRPEHAGRCQASPWPRTIFTTSRRATAPTIGLIARNLPLLGADGTQRRCPVRSAQAHLARIVLEFLRRRLHSDRAQRRAGEDDRGRAAPRRSAAPDRRHERRRRPARDVPKILRDTLKLNMKLVLGYRDSAALFLAMERGEISRPHGRAVGRPLYAAGLAQAQRRAITCRRSTPASNGCRICPTSRPRASLRPTTSRAR